MNYFIYGNEAYLSKNKLNEIIKEKVGIIDDINTIYFDFDNKNTTINALINECNTLPFFSNHKVVVVINPVFLKSKMTLSDEELANFTNYLNNPNIDTTLIIYSTYDKLDSRKKIYKTLIKTCRCFENKKMDDKEFIPYVKANLKKANIKISKDAIDELIKRLPNDLTNFHQELNKLSLYGDEINVKVIDKLIAPSYEDNVFKLVNAIQNGHCKEAIAYLHDLYALNFDPYYIMKLIAGQYRFLYQVKVLNNEYLSNTEISSRLGANPYRVTMCKKSLYNYSTKDLLRILSELCDLDIHFKRESTDRKLILEMFIINTTRRIICNH